ncbi:hypothetical protein AS593_19710 [Caulobacter vibrioides]|nr:hypothetical protein AS593_19710 [Caulobacter vibrioides]
MILRWLQVLLLSLALAVAPFHHAALAQPLVEPPPFNELEYADQGLGAIGATGGMLGAEKFNKAVVKSWFDHRDQISRMDRLMASASQAAPSTPAVGKALSAASSFLSAGLSMAKSIWHMVLGQYDRSLEEALGGVGQLVASIAAEGLILGAAAFLCASLGPVSLAICYGVVVVVGTYAAGEGGKWAGKWVGRKLYCRLAQSGACDAVPIAGEPVTAPPDRPDAAGPSGQVRADGAGRGASTRSASASAATSSAKANAISPRTSVSVSGSSSVTVRTDDVTTVATGGGRATTAIGSIRGGQSSTVVTNDVTTVASGRSASTDVGGSGTTKTGSVINQGGSLVIGSGSVQRDGRTCVDVYLNTCIVFQYRRKPDHGCPVGYWMSGRWCKLPADTDHKIPDSLAR